MTQSDAPNTSPPAPSAPALAAAQEQAEDTYIRIAANAGFNHPEYIKQCIQDGMKELATAIIDRHMLAQNSTVRELEALQAENTRLQTLVSAVGLEGVLHQDGESSVIVLPYGVWRACCGDAEEKEEGAV